MKERRLIDDLVGKIEAIYKSRGDEAPFGLASSSVETLRRHLDSLKSTSTGGADGASRKERAMLAKQGLS